MGMIGVVLGDMQEPRSACLSRVQKYCAVFALFGGQQLTACCSRPHAALLCTSSMALLLTVPVPCVHALLPCIHILDWASLLLLLLCGVVRLDAAGAQQPAAGGRRAAGCSRRQQPSAAGEARGGGGEEGARLQLQCGLQGCASGQPALDCEPPSSSCSCAGTCLEAHRPVTAPAASSPGLLMVSCCCCCCSQCGCSSQPSGHAPLSVRPRVLPQATQQPVGLGRREPARRRWGTKG